MTETNEFPELSAMAAQRQRTMLPGMLTAVRRRRQRRQAVRAAALVGVVALVTMWARSRAEPARQLDGPTAAEPSWTTFTDDPAVLSRCAVAPAVRAEWFVDDAGLQNLLATDRRAPGVVRIGTVVLVSAAAVDAWGSEADQAPDGGTGS